MLLGIRLFMRSSACALLSIVRIFRSLVYKALMSGVLRKAGIFDHQYKPCKWFKLRSVG